MIKYIAFALLIATACATVSLNLEHQKIDEELFSIMKKSAKDSTLEAKPLVPADSSKNIDRVYTTRAKVNGKERNVAFDTTTGYNWQYLEDPNPTSTGDIAENRAAEGRATIEHSNRADQKVELDHDSVKLDKVSFDASNVASSTANKGLFKAADHGLSLNRRYDTNFLHSLKRNGVKIEQPRAFSFYFSDNVNKVMFGEAEKFFTENGLEKLDAKSLEGDERWVVPVQDSSIMLDGLDSLEQSKKTYAIFDTTSRYTWMDTKLTVSIINRLAAIGTHCDDIGQGTTPVGVYDCDPKGKFPELKMMFKTIDAKDGKKSRDYVIRHYTEDVKDADGNDKKRLLFRQQALYESSTELAKKVPKLSEGDNTFIILGTNFLENVYVWFNAEDHTVNMGQTVGVVTQEKHIGSAARSWALALGTIGMVAAVAALFVILKKVPYTPSAQPALPKQQPLIVQRVQPQVLMQSVAVVQNQQPIQSRVMSSLPPQQQYVQQQQNFSPSRIVSSVAPQQYQQQF